MSQLECVPLPDDPSGCGSRRYSRVENWRDLTIMALADDEAGLRARIIDLEAERDIYRDYLKLALQRLARLTRQHDHLTSACDRLRDENRALRDEREP